MSSRKPATAKGIRARTHQIIFGTDTFWGKTFDIALLIIIIGSVLAVMMETVGPIQNRFGNLLFILEWVFTIFFTLEYILRLWCVKRPIKYATSFFGVIDLLAILPTYLSLIFAGTHYLLVIRALRLMRVFRIFKLAHFLNEGNSIVKALRASQAKITVFLVFILLLVTILGSLMYLVEGGQPDTGFTSIPRSVYWAIVTLTTVGYGDITPVTALGQFLSAGIMILGYAVIAVPTGIVTAELAAAATIRKQELEIDCPTCGKNGNDNDAKFCKHCGDSLEV